MSPVEEIKTRAMNDTFRINGFRRDELNDLINQLKTHPDAAKFKLRAKNRWIDGAQSLNLVSSFFGMGREFSARSTPFIQTTDTPTILLGKDAGPNPLEELLVALVASISTTLSYRATLADIKIEEIECDAEGDLDVQAMLQATDAAQAGFEQVRVTVRVKADASMEQLTALCALSPVYATLIRPLPVSISVKKD
jgi:uncharacterized OsmC-like protein